MTNEIISKAAREMARATIKVRKMDKELGERLYRVLAEEMARIQRGE